MQVHTSESTTAAVPEIFRAPEILAPAGDWECLRAAVENGADAVYFGLDRFNARMRAHNFRLDDLPEVVAYLHGRGVRGYVTFNTLVFSNEIDYAEDYLRKIIEAGVDACIVQDIGICRLIREISPDFPIHASTQMTITSGAGVRFAQDLGCDLVVLARESTLSDIARIRDSSASPRNVSLEVFVHGALCVAYSGQCLTSEALGGRSANRGECAQACRLPYELIVDGVRKDLGNRQYLLSPQDLAGLDVLPELVRAGVRSLKIEGRLKSPEYVANVTSIYRRALDNLIASGELAIGSADRYDLEMAFSRGLFTGWFRGIDNQRLVHGRYPKKRGVLVGKVLSVKGGDVTVGLSSSVKPGDGVVFDRGRPDEREEGGRIYSVDSSGQTAVLGFGHGDLDTSRIAAGDLVWKTSDPELDRRLRRTFEGDTIRFKRPLDAVVEGREGSPLKATFSDERGRAVVAESACALDAAKGAGLSEATLREKLGRLGDTPFELRNLDVRLEGALHLPVGEINRMRRDLAERIGAIWKEANRWTIREQAISTGSQARSLGERELRSDLELIVLVRSLEQLDGALRQGIRTIYCEMEEVKRYREAVRRAREAEERDGTKRSIWLAPPRVFKPGEEWILKLVRAAKPDGYLVRNHEHLEAFAGSPCRGDFSLNVANHHSAAYLVERYSLESLAASYDLNIEQLEALGSRADAARLEVTLHHNMPMFHMEHCVFCAFLSEGTDYTNCGRPCDRHELRIRDLRAGREHYVKADTGCRNTVFNGQSQSGAEYLARLVAAGFRRFRVEMMRENAEETVRAISLYGRLLAGEVDAESVWRELAASSTLGVTSGQLSGPAEHSRRVKPKSLAVLR